MKKTIITAIIFVVILIGAAVGYKYLSEGFKPEGNEPTDRNASESGQESLEEYTDFTVLDNDGNEVSLSDFSGKPMVINFWATWCAPCRSELSDFNKLYEENKDEIVFLMVNLTDGSRDTLEGVKEFVSEREYTFPVYFDTEYNAARAYGVNGIPMSVFINKDGYIADTHTGSMDEETLREYLDKLL